MKRKATIIRIAMLGLFAASTCYADNGVGIVAHRGFWDTPGSAQNSVKALILADSIGVYGSEFDVWLTADDCLVVNHDRTKGGYVIEESKAEDVLQQTLSNGETLPTLDAYLDAAAGLGVRLVFELKPHKDKEHEQKAVRMVLAEMEKRGLTQRVDYITFSLEAFKALIEQAPEGTPVYYLSGSLTPDELKDMGAAGLDYEINVLKAHPEWIGRCRELGLKTNVWTVNRRDDLQWCIDNGVDFITTNDPLLLQEMLAE